MALEYHSPGLRSGPTRHASLVEEAAVAMHREAVTAMRALGEHILASADLVEAEPFNDAAMLAMGERCARLDACVKAAAEKFTHARTCTGGIQ